MRSSEADVTRTLGKYQTQPHGRVVMGDEPLVFHCNYYNYFLQKTLRLDETLEMDAVIVDAAEAAAYAQLRRVAQEIGATTASERARLATSVFAELGFGLLDASATTPDGGSTRLSVSHYGCALRVASGADFERPQELFDAGYSAAAAAFIHDLPLGSYRPKLEACLSLGAPETRVHLTRCDPRPVAASPGAGPCEQGRPPPPNSDTSVDEGGILQALSGLDFSGNEEGLLPRFGLLLTRHYANFYNRCSFEFVRRMADTGLLEAAEELLVEAGLRCAFHTFGGIMTSDAWDAVVRPQCRRTEDWVHGMVATINALGWGLWRVVSLDPGRRLVVRVFDDYESCGHVAMYGQTKRPVSHLAVGAAAGAMNLIYLGQVERKPTLDFEAYSRVFEADEAFTARQTSSLAAGDPYTEIVAER